MAVVDSSLPPPFVNRFGQFKLVGPLRFTRYRAVPTMSIRASSEDDLGETLESRIACRSSQRTKQGLGACGLHAGRSGGRDVDSSGVPGKPASSQISAEGWFYTGQSRRLNDADALQDYRILRQDRVLAGAAGAMSDMAYRFWLPPSPAESALLCNSTEVDMNGVSLCTRPGGLILPSIRSVLEDEEVADHPSLVPLVDSFTFKVDIAFTLYDDQSGILSAALVETKLQVAAEDGAVDATSEAGTGEVSANRTIGGTISSLGSASVQVSALPFFLFSGRFLPSLPFELVMALVFLAQLAATTSRMLRQGSIKSGASSTLAETIAVRGAADDQDQQASALDAKAAAAAKEQATAGEVDEDYYSDTESAITTESDVAEPVANSGWCLCRACSCWQYWCNCCGCCGTTGQNDGTDGSSPTVSPAATPGAPSASGRSKKRGRWCQWSAAQGWLIYDFILLGVMVWLLVEEFILRWRVEGRDVLEPIRRHGLRGIPSSDVSAAAVVDPKSRGALAPSLWQTSSHSLWFGGESAESSTGFEPVSAADAGFLFAGTASQPRVHPSVPDSPALLFVDVHGVGSQIYRLFDLIAITTLLAAARVVQFLMVLPGAGPMLVSVFSTLSHGTVVLYLLLLAAFHVLFGLSLHIAIGS